MQISDFLKRTTDIVGVGDFSYQKTRPRIICKDGFSMSVQAGEGIYCTTRMCLDDGNYSNVEIGFPSCEEPLINEYAEDSSDYVETVYGYVPIELVEDVIIKHGGLSELEDIK